jgi:hypothetical protein
MADGLPQVSSFHAGAKTQLLVQEVFSGVNYLEALSKVQNPGLNSLTDLVGISEQGYMQSNTHSIFNKFTVFEYSKLNAGSRYRIDGHFIGFENNLSSKTDDQFSKENVRFLEKQIQRNNELSIENPQRKSEYQNVNKDLEEQAKRQGAILKDFKNQNAGTLSNPTASQLIKWGAENSATTPIGFQPYSLSDFIYCKNYGKIPNNRLVTLRRYPFPIHDSVRLTGTNSSQRKSMIPIAQAVTWFGSETDNTLNKMGVFAWDMPWKELTVDEPQIITGNEITLDELAAFANGLGPEGKTLAEAFKRLYQTAVNSDATRQESSGYEAKIQTYQKNLYDQTQGPYWNRIYGPVNVINKSTRRDRGTQVANWATPFTLNFHYSFRSFNGLSPKIAALDLISNFINLTYNDAQFLGQISRYFPKLGLKLSPSITEAIGKIMVTAANTTTGNSSAELNKVISEFYSLTSATASKIMDSPFGFGKDLLINNLMTKERAGQIAPDLISIKSALSDRPTGEWHMVVGNPTNPIFVMGNLIVTNTAMVWDDELGPDDFPTGVKFTVTLKQAQPRDKVAIERMLNLGQGKLTTGSLRTSSYEDTFGEVNSQDWNKLQSQSNTEVGPQLPGSATPNENSNPVSAFKQRVIRGYGSNRVGSQQNGFNSNAQVDDSILLMYYQRQYGKN